MTRDRKRGTAGAPVIRRRRPGGLSGPPEGFVGFRGDIAPGQADVMQIAGGPIAQFAARPVALVPDMEGFADLVDEPSCMMICHRIIGVRRHFQLLELTWKLISACARDPTNDNLYPFA